MIKPPYFSSPLEPCRTCGATGKVVALVEAKRRYLCDACRHSFDAEFTLEPKTLIDLTRTCPECGGRAFIGLESIGDVVRALLVLEEKCDA